MLEMRIYGNPVLRKTAKPVEKFDSGLKHFVEEMIETLRDQEGVGLAAPQVGESIQVAIVDITGGDMEPLVIINPEIISSSEEQECSDEGCLSIPEITLSVCRSVRVSLKAFDINGKQYTIDDAEGLLARALQHEIDHLNGIMIVDHVSVVQRSMISSKLKKLAKTGRDKSQAA